MKYTRDNILGMVLKHKDNGNMYTICDITKEDRVSIIDHQSRMIHPGFYDLSHMLNYLNNDKWFIISEAPVYSIY